MTNDLQKEAFIKYEANAWFKRNQDALMAYQPENDTIISLLKAYGLNPESILEIGCSAGYRLNALKLEFSGSTVYGLEPSTDAISFGKNVYPDVNFYQGTVDDLSTYESGQFDLVIVGFVFYVVDRTLLLKSIGEIDRVLKDKGHLVILDFFSETTLKRKYQHIDEFAAYSFKQNYDQVFSATQLYHLLNKSCFNHDTHKLDAETDFQNLFSISLLKKDLYASYR